MSAKSITAINNPAVCGAVSWRLFEYLNQGLFVILCPFKIELPYDFVKSSVIHVIAATSEHKEVLDNIIGNPEYHKAIAENGKHCFYTYCTPAAQAKYIVDSILDS